MRRQLHCSPIGLSPDPVEMIGRNDTVGQIYIRRSRQRCQVEAIGWATLSPEDKLCSGTIKLEWPADDDLDDVVAKNLYSSAAKRQNEHLVGAIVRRKTVTGSDHDELIYREAGIKPTWRRGGSAFFPLYGELKVALKPHLGFQPYLPDYQGLPVEKRSFQELTDYRVLRAFARAVGGMFRVLKSYDPLGSDQTTVVEIIRFSNVQPAVCADAALLSNPTDFAQINRQNGH